MTQPFNQFLGSKSVLVRRLQLRPWCASEEDVLILSCLSPRNVRFELLRGGLLDAEPIVLERFLVVPNELNPIALLPLWYAIRLCEDAYPMFNQPRISTFLNRVEKTHQQFVGLEGHISLQDGVLLGFQNRLRREEKLGSCKRLQVEQGLKELTFAGNREKNDTAGFLHVRSHQVFHKSNVVAASLPTSHTGNESFKKIIETWTRKELR